MNENVSFLFSGNFQVYDGEKWEDVQQGRAEREGEKCFQENFSYFVSWVLEIEHERAIFRLISMTRIFERFEHIFFDFAN